MYTLWASMRGFKARCRRLRNMQSVCVDVRASMADLIWIMGSQASSRLCQSYTEAWRWAEGCEQCHWPVGGPPKKYTLTLLNDDATATGSSSHFQSRGKCDGQSYSEICQFQFLLSNEFLLLFVFVQSNITKCEKWFAICSFACPLVCWPAAR